MYTYAYILYCTGENKIRVYPYKHRIIKNEKYNAVLKMIHCINQISLKLGIRVLICIFGLLIPQFSYSMILHYV